VLPTATGAAFANAGPDPAVALAAGIFPAGVSPSKFGRVGLARWSEDWSPGATVQPLAGGGLIDASAVSATVTLQRVSLGPDEQAPLTAPGSIDLAVESGALTLKTEGGLVWQQHPTGQDQFIEPAHIVTLLPGDAALLQDASSVTLRNAGHGPLLLLVLTVVPTVRATPAGGERARSPELKTP
jgi:hypothetical protein